MSPTRPDSARLTILMDARGRMHALYDGEPMAGVTDIVCEQARNGNPRALVTLSFIGLAVKFETEPSTEGAA